MLEELKHIFNLDKLEFKMCSLQNIMQLVKLSDYHMTFTSFSEYLPCNRFDELVT
jgi:hypothetical protein